METLLLISILFVTSAFAESKEYDCHAPGQGHLEMKLKESFHTELGESELKEWMMHPRNEALREDIKSIDRRVKFSGRLQRESLLSEAKIKFEDAIVNNGRPSEISDFPAKGSHSKIAGTEGALSLEMNNLSKDELDVLPKEILDKLDSKVKINYYFPYDKFEYLLTYDGRELPMMKAFSKIQKDFEEACEIRKKENRLNRRWDREYMGVGESGSRGQ